MKGRRLVLKSFVFLVLLAVAVYSIQGIFCLDEQRVHDDVRAFYSERKGSLDGVFIGSSAVYTFFQPLCAWHMNGIAVWNWSIPAMPPLCVKYHVIEARKRQPDAVYIIALNMFRNESETTRGLDTHRNTNYMPLSLNKLRLLNAMVSRLDEDMTPLEKLEFYLPIITFHSRWDSMEPWSLEAEDVDYKSSNHGDKFLYEATDYSERLFVYEARFPISDYLESVLNDLLDYLDAHQVKALFVNIPQNQTRHEQGKANTAKDIVLSRGYPCLDLMEELDRTGLDLRMDIYNDRHADIHGSLKITRTVSEYLIEHYHLEDKRDLAEWDDWNEAADAYMDYISAATLDFERSGDRRAITEIPQVATKVRGQEIRLSWNRVEEADQYAIYRKREGAAWQAVAKVDSDVTKYLDTGLDASTRYTYTVVPEFWEAGEMIYGSFDVKGFSAKTRQVDS